MESPRLAEIHARCEKARAATTVLRDHARQYGMTHFTRDPLVMDVHRSLDDVDVLLDLVHQLYEEITMLRAGTPSTLPSATRRSEP